MSWVGTRAGWLVCETATMRWCKKSGLSAPWWTNIVNTASLKCRWRKWTARGNQHTDVRATRLLTLATSSHILCFSSLLCGFKEIFVVYFISIPIFVCEGLPSSRLWPDGSISTLRRVCTFSSKFNVMNLCNKLRYISMWG